LPLDDFIVLKAEALSTFKSWKIRSKTNFSKFSIFYFCIDL